MCAHLTTCPPAQVPCYGTVTKQLWNQTTAVRDGPTSMHTNSATLPRHPARAARALCSRAIANIHTAALPCPAPPAH